jgi:hypothetical protein
VGCTGLRPDYVISMVAKPRAFCTFRQPGV